MSKSQSLQDNVKAFVSKTLSEININRDDEEARINAIRAGLGLITDEFGVEEYSFNLAMDVFVEAAYKNLSDCLEKILGEADYSADDDRERNVIFATYYALSLIRKKQDDVKGLRELLDERYDDLRDFALHFEVHSRYYKRVDMFRDALSCDKRAINVLRRKSIVNVALCISYASTVCTMLKKKDTSLHSEDIDLAKNYIEAAIDFNPNYPKYYFLKAQLVFLSAMRGEGDLSLLEKAGREANELIDDADVLLYEIYHDRNVFVTRERAKYEEFKFFIEDIIDRKKTPRFPKTDEELDALKAKILEADSQDECVSSFILPPIPALHSGDKYFFICYSSRDFKSVYCDLIELYRRKVPFRYDERLTQGVGWQGQIENGIGSKDCEGVVFYLSKNVMATGSVCEEIEITRRFGKGHFCVNLEGSTTPSKMLTDLLIERYTQNPNNYYLPGDNMRTFLTFFLDNAVFTHKFRKNGDDGVAHFEAYIDALINKFPQMIIGD